MGQTETFRVKKLDIFGVDEVAETLACAFAEDPVCKFAFGSEVSDRAERLRPLFFNCVRFLLRKGERCGILYATEDKKSVALWFRSELKINWLDRILFTVSKMSSFRSTGLKMVKIIDACECHRPTKKCMYLWMFATHPDVQREGHASKLLSHMLKECDEEGLPVYLESSNPKYLSFYESHGFRAQGRISELPEGCPDVSVMWRDPQEQKK